MSRRTKKGVTRTRMHQWYARDFIREAWGVDSDVCIVKGAGAGRRPRLQNPNFKLHCRARSAILALPFVREHLIYGCKADKEVDEPLDDWP